MDTQAQMQAIVDKVSGAGKAPVPLAAFDDPWRKIYFRVTRAGVTVTRPRQQSWRPCGAAA